MKNSKISMVIKILMLTSTIILTLSSLTFGETLFFGVSLFDIKYGPVMRYNFKFWKFESDFYLPLYTSIDRGFVKFDINSNKAIERFHFEDDIYKVTYDNINTIPFSTFANPAYKTWNVSWLNTGIYDDYLFYKSDYFSLIGNGEKINIGLKLPFSFFSPIIFLEKDANKVYGGIGTGIERGLYIFVGQKNGIGINYIFDGPNKSKVLTYTTAYLDYDGNFDLFNIEIEYGLTIRMKDFEINLLNTYMENQKNVLGTIKWKAGDVYVIGQLQGEKVRISTEFPIW
ncbi:MAG: hypothetical protein ACK4R7_03560 [Fervidobacterium sp.]